MFREPRAGLDRQSGMGHHREAYVLRAPDIGAIDEAGLIRRAQAGDAVAFTRLIEPRQDSLYRSAWAILRDDADASDGLQEACVSAWREVRRLRDPDRFDAWLTRILVNRCRTILRTRRRVTVREIDVEAADVQATKAARPGEPESIAELDAIRRSFSRLDPDQRTLIALYYVDDHSISEVAAILGIPDGTVKSRLSRARNMLARALAREER
jgi:RNA polymerase sigma-70 factor, ECF subfamily